VATYYYFSFFRPQDYYHWALTGSRLSYYIALVAIYSFFVNKGKYGYTLPKTKETMAVLIFWIFMLFSCFFSPFPDRSWPTFEVFSKIIIFYYFALAMINSEKKFKIMLWVLIYSFVYYAIWANWRYIFEGIKIMEGPGLAEADYRDRNTFSLIFVVAIPICFYMRYIMQHKLIKYTLLAAIPVLMHAIVATFSRGGYLGMLVASGYSILNMKKKGAAILTIMVFIPLLLQMQGAEHRNRMNSILVEGEERETSAESRIEAWKGGIKMMQDHPILGVGLQNFEVFIKKYNPNVVNMVAHNTYIQIGAEIGIPAMSLYILILLFSLFTLHKLRRKVKAEGLSENLHYYTLMLEGSILGFIICSIFLSMELFEPSYFLFCMVVCLKVLTDKGAFVPRIA